MALARSLEGARRGTMLRFSARDYAFGGGSHAVRGTRHPFAVSGLVQPSQKIELMFSRQPRNSL